MNATGYTGIDNLEAMEEARNYNRFLVEAILAASDARQPVDFGAGLGTLAEPLRDRGRTPVCVEVDPDLCRDLAEKGFEVARRLGELPGGSQRYIYSVNVLEHIEDDEGTLKEMYDALGPGGTLFLYVPAFPVLFSAMDEKIGHFRRYRLRGLCRLLIRLGFRVEQARYVDSLGFFASLVYKMAGNRTGRIDARWVRVYDRWLFPPSRLIDVATGKWFGKNLLVRASRP